MRARPAARRARRCRRSRPSPSSSTRPRVNGRARFEVPGAAFAAREENDVHACRSSPGAARPGRPPQRLVKHLAVPGTRETAIRALLSVRRRSGSPCPSARLTLSASLRIRLSRLTTSTMHKKPLAGKKTGARIPCPSCAGPVSVADCSGRNAKGAAFSHMPRAGRRDSVAVGRIKST